MADMELIGHLAELSGIRFSAAELEKMRREMEDIMVLMDKVKDAPENSASNQQTRMEYARLRKDTAQKPEAKNTEFTVPKIVG